MKTLRLIPFVACALVSCDGTPLETLVAPPAYDLSVETATLRIDLTWNGVPLEGPSSSVPGNQCFLVSSGPGWTFCGPSGTRTGLAVGETSLTMRSYWNSSIVMVPAADVTLLPGLNVHTIDLAEHAGRVQGSVSADGVAATSGYAAGFTAENQHATRYQFNWTYAGDFTLFVPPGSGHVRYHSAAGALMAEAAYTVAAGATVSVDEMSVESATLRVDVLYNGEPIAGTASTVPGNACFLMVTSTNWTMCGPTGTRTGLVPGTTTLTVRSYWNSAITLVPATEITLEPGLNVHTIELADYVGVVEGSVTEDGAAATSGYVSGLNAQNQIDGRYAFTSFYTGAFRMYVTPGSGIVRAHSSSGAIMATAAYTVVAGETTDVGEIATQTATLRVDLTWGGEPIEGPASTIPGFNCFLVMSATNWTMCGPSGTRTGLSPGETTVSLRMYWNSGVVAGPAEAITLAPGLNVHAFELSEQLGIVTGDVNVDGAPATQGYVMAVNAQSQVVGRYSFTSTYSGSFRMYLPPGTGEVRYMSAANVLMASAPYTVVAGETSTLGTIQQHQSIIFAALPDRTYGDAPFAVNATASSGLAVSLVGEGVCTLDGSTVTLTAAGSCTVTASQAGNDDFHPAEPVARTFTVTRAPQTIVFAALPDRYVGDAPFAVSATGGGSGNPVVFTAGPSAVCTLDDGTITIVGEGTCDVAAEQAGDANHDAAEPVTRSFVVSVPPNEAPVVTAITLPAGPVMVNSPVTLTASFTDGDADDSHTGEIDWGPVTRPATIGTGARTLSGTHSYTAAGIYTANVSVNDGQATATRSSTQDVPAQIVVVDPSAGFVTGGGWIRSPSGACRLSSECLGTTGRLEFGFNARYHPRRLTLNGSVEIELRAGGLEFRSTAVEWLVVSGAQAQFAGSGTINGAGDFAFLVTAIDGRAEGTQVDQVRIVITDRSSGVVVYDSGPATATRGGNIVLHRGR